MCEGYNADAGDYSGLEDEFLCEYVDGTMDPLVREVFEEYLRMNPDLKDHVRCLQNTRMLLCRYGCGCHAPDDLHDRLRREISFDLMRGQVPFHLVLSDRLRSFATATSAMALLVLVGMMVGGTLLDSGPNYDASGSRAVEFGLQNAQKVSLDLTAVTPRNLHGYAVLSTFAPLSPFRSVATVDSHSESHRRDSSSIAALEHTQPTP